MRVAIADAMIVAATSAPAAAFDKTSVARGEPQIIDDNCQKKCKSIAAPVKQMQCFAKCNGKR